MVTGPAIPASAWVGWTVATVHGLAEVMHCGSWLRVVTPMPQPATGPLRWRACETSAGMNPQAAVVLCQAGGMLLEGPPPWTARLPYLE